MAQFDVYRSLSPAAAYVIDLQDEVVDDLATRVVAPLVAMDDVPHRMKIINPVLRIDGTEYVLMTHLLAAIPVSFLQNRIFSASGQRDEIIASVDFLVTGI
jgi:toxin CcdB